MASTRIFFLVLVFVCSIFFILCFLIQFVYGEALFGICDMGQRIPLSPRRPAVHRP